MVSNRKYSRSRSPIEERSNRHKHEDSRRRRSPSPHRRDRSRERSRHYRGEKHRGEHSHRDADDQRHHRNTETFGGSQRSRQSPIESSHRSHHSRHEISQRKSSDRPLSRSPRYKSTSTAHEAKSLRSGSELEKDFVRLESSTKSAKAEDDAVASQTDMSRKRKANTLNDQTVTSDPAQGRRSRFDRPAQSTNQEILEAHDKIAVDSPSQAVVETKTGTKNNEVLSVPDTEQEKLRQRQERLAVWKKKKLEDAAKQDAMNGKDPSGTSRQGSSSNLRNPHLVESKNVPPKEHIISAQTNEGSSKPSVGIGKFGMVSKPTNSYKYSVPSKTLGFVEDEQSNRSLVAVDNTETTTIDALAKETTNIIQSSKQITLNIPDDDEIDPLDAFMVQNSASLNKSTGISRSAGDVINDQESDTGYEVAEEEDILALAAKKAAQKKKDIVTVNHAMQEYEPFRKDFYVEPAELADLSEADVDAMRLELDGIVIRGKDCPKPILNWGQCGLSADTLEQIHRLGYDSPTSIQAQAIPAIMSGRDTIGVAKTGSGKTMAFLLPMFRHIKDQRPLDSMEGPIAMILTPTRELAVQIHKECKPFLKALDLRAVCVYGGPPIKEQIAEFKRGAEIVVCTPGRMIDILAANQGRVTNLRRITYTVLDEADRMFDLGFEPQVMKIINNIRPQRQTVLFSATFPKSMEALARKILRGKPVEVTVGARSVVAPEITQKIEIRPRDPDPLKFNRVLEILGELYNTDEDARTLIFVDRQEAADSLLYQLMRKGYPCNALHGGKDQYDRDSTISDFKAGIFPILVATSVAARGLDVKQLKLVINYDCPNHMEDYVHRVGRTGRAGNAGTAITFISEDQERYAFDIARALRLSQVAIPEPLKVLADAFAEKVKTGVEKGSVAGFGGKGLAKFDTARDNEKRVQRKIYGEDDEPEENSTTRQVELSEDEDDDASDNDRVNPEEVRAVETMGTSASADAPIKVEKVTAQMRQATTAKPNVGTKALDPVAAARARIDAINNRIKTGTKPLEQAASNPDAGEYRAMMEINDYPQKARWNVTNRTNIAKVLEATGTSITTQGQYVKPGSSAPAGVPKLYLLVEGPTELCVTDAVKELRRLLAEGTLADADAAGTRYKVV